MKQAEQPIAGLFFNLGFRVFVVYLRFFVLGERA